MTNTTLVRSWEECDIPICESACNRFAAYYYCNRFTAYYYCNSNRVLTGYFIFGTEKKSTGANKEKGIATTESQLQHTGCTYQVCSRPGLGNDTSLPACEEYVEDNPRLQVGYTVAQMFETGSFFMAFFRLNLPRLLSP